MASALRTMGLFLLMTGLFIVIGWIVGAMMIGSPMLGMGLFLVIAALFNLATYFFSDRMILWAYGAKIVEPEEAPRLHRIVKNLVQRTDLPMPRIAVIPGMAPNAFATGRNPDHAVVAATAGLLQTLNDEELAGVMAHELAHVKNRDILIMSLAATLAGAITFAARALFWNSLFGGNRDQHPAQMAVGLVLMILAPIAAFMVQATISRAREFVADRVGAEIHGNPLALANALRRLDAYANAMPVQQQRQQNPATSHMFIVNPLRGGTMARMFSTHPPMEDRIKALEALAYKVHS